MFKNMFARTSYALLLGLMVLAYIFYRSYFILLFIIFMIVLPFISIPMLLRTKGQLKLSIEAPAIVEKNAPVHIKINIDNPSYIPVIQSQLTLSVTNAFYPGSPEYKLFCGISARKGASVDFTITPSYSGNIRFNIQELKCWDFTGMANITLKDILIKEISVMPISDGSDMELSMVGGAGLVELSEQEIKGNDSSTIIDTRDYQPGDKLQRIHWKLSTKLDKLLVKEYGSMSSQDVLVILDMTHGSFDEIKKSDNHIKNRLSFDSIFDTYATLADCLIKQKRPFMVGWYSSAADELKILEITNKAEFTESLLQMYYEKPASEGGAAKLLAKSVLDDYGVFLYIHPCMPIGICENEKEIIFEKLSDTGKKLSEINVIGSI